jgi:hypothetical protein
MYVERQSSRVRKIVLPEELSALMYRGDAWPISFGSQSAGIRHLIESCVDGGSFQKHTILGPSATLALVASSAD